MPSHPRPIRRGPRVPRRMHARPSGRCHRRGGAPRPRALGGRHRRRVRVLGGRRARPRARGDAARRRRRPHRHGIAGLGVRRARRGIRPRRRRGGLRRRRLLVGRRALPRARRPARAPGAARPRSPTRSAPTRGWRRTRSCSPRRARSPMRHPSPRPRSAADARVLVDTTQATGWMPTTDLDADLIVCHAYKWLCAPRGAAFAAFSTACDRRDHAVHGGLVLGRRPVGVVLRPRPAPRPRTPRGSTSPPPGTPGSGAEAALGFAASLDADEVRDHAVGLANAFRERLDIGAVGQRDRDVARRRRHRARRALRARASPRRDAPGARGWRSTSGTTTRTSTSPRRRSVAERRGCRTAAAQRAARTVFDSVPRPDTVTSTVSPSTMGPTPAGVPVRITSPGSSVNTLDA